MLHNSVSTGRQLLAQVNIGEAYRLRPDGPAVADVYDSPASLINALLPNLYVIAGILLFVFIFAAGFRIIMNPDNKKNMEEGRKAIVYALGGFILLIAAFWIMQIIAAITGIEVL